MRSSRSGPASTPTSRAAQNALSHLASYGIRGREAEERLREIIEFAEIESYIDQPVKTYSTGMGVRLMFAASTAIVPEVLILDEVLSVGDAYFAHKSFERIREMTDTHGSTLLIVSHDISRTMMLCNRLVWIDGGRVRMDGKPAEVANRYALSVREQEEQRLRQRRIEVAGLELASEKEEPKAAVEPARIAFGHLRRKGGMPLTSDLPIARTAGMR
jgi:lipopolysaccharide transport system ATP-binding protein